MGSVIKMIHAVFICTKNREDDVIRLLATLEENKVNPSLMRIMIADSTEPMERFQNFGRRIKVEFPLLNIQHFFHLGGLPSARNACIERITNEDLIHFFDDDVTIPGNYFTRIENFLDNNPDCFGGGPKIKGLYLERATISQGLLRRLVGLQVKFGKVTKSGRHYWVPEETSNSFDVEWIPGCSMFFKRDIFDRFTFNATMENGPGKNYALGEDLDFSHRVSKVYSLKSVSDLTIVHHQAPSKRDNWLLIARASGAQYSYLLRTFPGEFSAIKIHFGRLLDFTIMNRPISMKSISTIVLQFVGYLSEFRRENVEKLINLDHQKLH